RRLGFGDAVRDGGGSEDLAQERGQLLPLAILATAPDGLGKRLEALQDLDLGFELVDRARRGRLVDDLLLGGLELVLGRVLEVLDILGAERRDRGDERRLCPTALEQLELAEAGLEPLAPSAERLVDRLGRGGEAALEDGQRKADGAGAPVVLERFRAGA